MAEPALRAIAAVGVLSVGLLIGGFSASPVWAQPADSDGSTQTSPDTGGSADTTGTGSESTSGSKDSGTSDTSDTSASDSSGDVEAPSDNSSSVSVETGGSTESGGGSDGYSASEPATPVRESDKTGYGHSISIPLPRLPHPGEITRGTLPPPSTFYTTISIPLPTLSQFLAALQILPPTPPPGPAFRTQEEAPVIDASTGTARSGGGGGADPNVFRAPLVVTVPRAITVAGRAPMVRLPRGLSADAGSSAPGVAGANTPAIRGSVPPTPGATAAPMARDALPSAGSPRAEAMPRAFARPTVAQLAAVALPGVAGLIVITFGGGVVGYRQANSLRHVRTAGAERFLA